MKTLVAAHEQESRIPYSRKGVQVAGIALVSAVYFADIFIRASQKCYWFDELFTVYLCRLHSFNEVWAAAVHGADFNPPLFYLLIRASRSLFGDGLIATRLPATIGVWVFCMSLFLFVSRRTGLLCGFIAGVFPFFTVVQYYAYEARAHGISLGWCGLAILCWQMIAESRKRFFWRTAFFLSIAGALLTHIYAIYLLFPFTLVEFYNIARRRRPDWGILVAMGAAFSSIATLIYLPLVRAYRGNVPTTLFPVSHDLFQRFLTDTLGPAILIFLVLLLVLCVQGKSRASRPSAGFEIKTQELVLAIGFACVPALGLVGSKISHGPFIGRYFLIAIAGYSILLGFALARIQISATAIQALGLFMFFLMVSDLVATVYLAGNHRLMLNEPSSGVRISTNPDKPMDLYETLGSNPAGLDIMVLGRMECLYFYRYAPAAVVPHLYFGAASGDPFLTVYARLSAGAQLGLKVTTFEDFLQTHNRFLVYSSPLVPAVDAQQAFAAHGYQLKSAHGDAAGATFEYAR